MWLNLSAVSPYNKYSREFSHSVTIYDTTLRDGEQTPGVFFTVEEKLEIARKLDEFGIPQIEAGFPIVSKDEAESVKMITNEGLSADILVLARARRGDIDEALRCDVDGVIVFIPLSSTHLTNKLGMSLDEALNAALETVEYAKMHGLFTQLSVEDATRTPFESIKALFESALKLNVDRLSLADTTGCITPRGMARLVGRVKREIGGKVAVHCHNDFGLAVANSLAAYEAGADAISVSINGLGERCGNAALEEVVGALYFLYGVDLGFKMNMLKDLSSTVARLSGVPLTKGKPVVGENAFRHESGIHVAAVLKDPLTYECYSPEFVGQERSIVFGKKSGITGILYTLKKYGLEVDEHDALIILNFLKSSVMKRYLSENELLDLAMDLLGKKLWPKLQ